MRSNNVLIRFILALAVALAAGCSGGGGGGGSAPKTLVSITVTPANPSVTAGATQQFSATGTFSDGTTQGLTTTVTWSSSLTSVATISNSTGSNGMATAVAAGTTTITATSGSISGSTGLTVTGGGGGQANVLAVTVNGSLCSSGLSSGSYPNKPCVSVTICTPGTSACQTITDILLDTGSNGLRIFKQALNVSLPQVTVASGSLAECIQYGDGSSDWGPIQMANVVLGGEPAVQVPIQVIDATFGSLPSACGNADTKPSDAGFNGILGVGLFAHDCGAACVSSALWYYACNGSACSGSTAPLASQVQNPVALLPRDNNGVLVQLPGVSLGGVPSLSGSLILGIGTQANNASAAVTAYPADSSGNFTTTFNGTSFSTSFIDSGSNGLFFSAPATLLPGCTANPGFYCPPATVSLSATNTGAFGSPSGVVPFQIGNLDTLVSSGNNVFVEAGGSGGSGFDWGLPFFFGRNVFVGIEGTRSGLGSGAYWAY